MRHAEVCTPTQNYVPHVSAMIRMQSLPLFRSRYSQMTAGGLPHKVSPHGVHRCHPQAVADPIAFPLPVLHQSIMTRAPVTCENNVNEYKVVLETSSGNFYEIGRMLRETIYGQVIHAIELIRGEDGHLSRKSPINQLAIKIYSNERLRTLKKKTQENPSSEIAAMQFIGKHRHIVGQIECCRDKNNVYSIMEFADGGELFDYIDQEGPINEDCAREMFSQILLGLMHLHDAGIAHRDLTLENIMCSRSGICKLIDFGMSLRLPRVPDSQSISRENEVQNDQSRPVMNIPPQGTCGKPNYIAPEVMKNTEDFNPQLSDIWSLGVMLFIMLTGVPPVAVAYDLDDRYRVICEGGLEAILIQWDFHLSSDAVNLLNNLLRPHPQERLTVKEIIDHPWTRKRNPLMVKMTRDRQDMIYDDWGIPLTSTIK